MLSYPFDDFGKPLAQVLRETPQPTGSEVVVRIGSCGLCHSDVHLHEGYFDLGNGQKLDLSRGIAPPRVLGHEIAGTVVAVGPDAGGAAVGDRRVVFPWIGCTVCGPCKEGREELCVAPRALGINRDGGFADHVLVPHPRYLFAYDPLPEAEACTYACSGLTAWSALRKCAPPASGDALLIIGAGGVGLSAVMGARLAGAEPIIVADVDEAKLERARILGATMLVLAGRDDTVETVLDELPGGVDWAIEAVGRAETLQQAVACLRPGGTAVALGIGRVGATFQVSINELVQQQKRVVGSLYGSANPPLDLPRLWRLYEAGRLPLDSLLGAEYPLASVNDAYDALVSGAVGRAVLRP